MIILSEVMPTTTYTADMIQNFRLVEIKHLTDLLYFNVDYYFEFSYILIFLILKMVNLKF